MAILMIVENLGDKTYAIHEPLFKAAQKLKEPITALIVGTVIVDTVEHDTLEKIKAISQVEKIDIYGEDSTLTPETIVKTVKAQVLPYTYVMALSKSLWKNTLPRMAGAVGGVQISNVFAMDDQGGFIRSCYAGRIWATEQTQARPLFITVSPIGFKQDTLELSNNICVSCQEKTWTPSSLIKLLESHRGTKEGTIDLAQASVVVGGGMGLGSKQGFGLIHDLAHVLKGGVGATRDAVDAGYIGHEHQVGQSGKIIAPRLYLAIGISGALQHCAGIRGSEIIIAINKDEQAPIFKMANYGLVADLFDVVPKLIEQLKK